MEHLPPFAESVYASMHLLDRGARPRRSEYTGMTISINQSSAFWGGGDEDSQTALLGFSRVSSAHVYRDRRPVLMRDSTPPPSGGKHRLGLEGDLTELYVLQKRSRLDNERQQRKEKSKTKCNILLSTKQDSCFNHSASLALLNGFPHCT